jgi:hypothetical protein
MVTGVSNSMTSPVTSPQNAASSPLVAVNTN